MLVSLACYGSQCLYLKKLMQPKYLLRLTSGPLFGELIAAVLIHGVPASGD